MKNYTFVQGVCVLYLVQPTVAQPMNTMRLSAIFLSGEGNTGLLYRNSGVLSAKSAEVPKNCCSATDPSERFEDYHSPTRRGAAAAVLCDLFHVFGVGRLCQVLNDGLRLYGPGQLIGSYNGGKDAVVIMHLHRCGAVVVVDLRSTS